MRFILLMVSIMHRDADGARLVGDRAGDGLADPPRGVGRELVAAAVFELVHRLHQADVAFLDQVEEPGRGWCILAMEITRRRLASVISRLARRDLASPVDICFVDVLEFLERDADAFCISMSFSAASSMIAGAVAHQVGRRWLGGDFACGASRDWFVAGEHLMKCGRGMRTVDAQVRESCARGLRTSSTMLRTESHRLGGLGA